MRPEAAHAERMLEVRDAARSWRRTEFINDEVLSRILARHGDDRSRLGPAFRALAFILSGVAAFALIGLSALILRFEGAALPLLWAVALVSATEYQVGPLRRSQAGAETATALIAALCLLIAIEEAASGWSMDRVLFSTTVVCLAAAYRWGDWPFFFLGGLTFYGLLARWDHGRLLWIVAGAALIPAGIRAMRSKDFPPSHRRGAGLLVGISVLALYCAVHIWSWDHAWIEGMGSRPVDTVAFRGFGVLATAALPILFLIAGWTRREPALLASGLLLATTSIATIRLYYSVMPLSVALILAGCASMALAIALRRYLRSGPEGERNGFTADPLFDDQNRTSAVRTALSAAAFTPAAATPTADPAFTGQGGRFGGGGSTGTF